MMKKKLYITIATAFFVSSMILPVAASAACCCALDKEGQATCVSSSASCSPDPGELNFKTPFQGLSLLGPSFEAPASCCGVGPFDVKYPTDPICKSAAPIGVDATPSPENDTSTTDKVKVDFTPGVTIPGTSFQAGVPIQGGVTGRTLGEYISALYVYFSGAVGILAAVMLLYGGIRWLTAAGNESHVESAKETIYSAIIAMVLVLTSYVLLNTINPELVGIRDLSSIIKNISPTEGETAPQDPALLGTCQENATKIQSSKNVIMASTTCDKPFPGATTKYEIQTLASYGTCTMQAISGPHCPGVHDVTANAGIVAGLSALAQTGCSFTITAFGNGDHDASNSRHYAGNAVDIDVPSGCSTQQVLDAFCGYSGLSANSENFTPGVNESNEKSHWHIGTDSFADQCPK